MSIDPQDGTISSTAWDRIFYNPRSARKWAVRLWSLFILSLITLIAAVTISLWPSSGPFEPVTEYTIEVVPDEITPGGTFALVRTICSDEAVAGTANFWLIDPNTEERILLLVRGASLSFEAYPAPDKCSTATFSHLELMGVDGEIPELGIYQMLLTGTVGTDDQTQPVFVKTNLISVVEEVENGQEHG